MLLLDDGKRPLDVEEDSVRIGVAVPLMDGLDPDAVSHHHLVNHPVNFWRLNILSFSSRLFSNAVR